MVRKPIFMKIILLGYMASGKSTIAKSIAKNLQLPAMDLDDYIVKKEGSSIQDIFKSKGEIFFRKQEAAYLKELILSENSFVLALGGGTPCYGNNMELLKELPTTIYLKANLKTLFGRVHPERVGRPLISDLNDDQLYEFIAKHLFERSPYYEKAKYIITVDGKSTDQIVEEIRQLVQIG